MAATMSKPETEPIQSPGELRIFNISSLPRGSFMRVSTLPRSGTSSSASVLHARGERDRYYMA